MRNFKYCNYLNCTNDHVTLDPKSIYSAQYPPLAISGERNTLEKHKNQKQD